MQFEWATITPEEQRRNLAQSIVHGYQTPRLGRLQIALLKQMIGDRHEHSPLGGNYWGSTYRNRRTLASLERRDLVSPSATARGGLFPSPSQTSWNLTELGFEVAALLRKDPFA